YSAVAEALGRWLSRHTGEIGVGNDELRLVDVEVVAFVAVVHEQPELARAVRDGHVGRAVHPERRIEPRERGWTRLFARRRRPARILQRDGRDAGRLLFV